MSKTIIDQKICEGAECNEFATMSLDVTAGKYGRFHFTLCGECAKYFLGFKGCCRNFGDLQTVEIEP
jgi:hypothetical protein